MRARAASRSAEESLDLSTSRAIFLAMVERPRSRKRCSRSTRITLNPALARDVSDAVAHGSGADNADGFDSSWGLLVRIRRGAARQTDECIRGETRFQGVGHGGSGAESICTEVERGANRRKLRAWQTRTLQNVKSRNRPRKRQTRSWKKQLPVAVNRMALHSKRNAPDCSGVFLCCDRMVSASVVAGLAVWRRRGGLRRGPERRRLPRRRRRLRPA